VAEAGLAERLTVVLLTYNCATRVGTVLQRLCRLGVPVVVVDNGSTDRTCAIIRAGFSDRVHLIEVGRNIGAAARNLGAERARTAYVAFCDDDGWYEPAGLATTCDLFDAHPPLGLVNGRILVGAQRWLDPICQEMQESPLRDRDGIPGQVLLGFMAGACIARRSAFLEVGGYDGRTFIGGEEEPLALALAKAGWQMRYVDALVVAHWPSLAHFEGLRAYGMRNTLWAAWLHRRLPNALRHTIFTLLDHPKNLDYVRGVAMAAGGLPWVLRERRPVSTELDRDLRQLDERRQRRRRRFLTRRHPPAAQRSPWAEPSATRQEEFV
jgi:GT2 family glycosyltransferase